MKKVILTIIVFSFVFIQIGKAQTNEPILRLNLEMHNNDIYKIDTDSKGKNILTISFDKTAKLWNAHTGKLIRIYRFQIGAGAEGELFAGAISPNSEIIAVTGKTGETRNRSIYIFNTHTGKLIKTLSGIDNVVVDMEFSHNGKYLAAALSGSNRYGVVIYKTNLSEITNLTNLRIEKIKTLSGYGKGVLGVGFSSVGKFASVCYDGKIRLYDKNFHLINETIGSGNKPISIAFSPDANKIAVGYNDVSTIEVRSANNLQLLYKPELGGITKAGAFMHVAFSADGEYLYGAGNYSEYTYSSRYWVYRKWLNQGKGTYKDYRETFVNFTDIKSICLSLYVPKFIFT